MTTPTEHVTRSRYLIMKYPGEHSPIATPGPLPGWNLPSVSGWSSSLPFCAGVATGGECHCSWWRRCPSGSPTNSFSRASEGSLQDAAVIDRPPERPVGQCGEIVRN